MMITSRQNSFIKELRLLKDKKNRDEKGVYLIESVKLIKEAIISKKEIVNIVGTENGLKDFREYNFNLITVSEEVFKAVSSEVSPQGVIAVVKKEIPVSFNGETCLLLDGVSDPANVGAIIRTAAASGYRNVFITEDSADEYSPKALRASMGGVFKVNTYRIKRENAESIGLPFIIADMNGENVFEFKFDKKFCLVIGNEGNGISKEIKNLAYKTVKIPMENDVESLNASVSAGILMYALKK